MRKFGMRLFLSFLLICALVLPVSAAQYLIPGGQVIGMHLADDSVSVAAIDETLGAAAKAAGLMAGDRIVSVNGKTVRTPEDVRAALKADARKAEVCVLRNGKTKTVTFCPAATPEGPRLGVYLKQGITGIGTVTFYDPQKQTFGALGHGVNNAGGQLLKLNQGNIYEACVLSVKKGKVGAPGQLMGSVTDPQSLGALSKNTAQGVFGTMTAPDAEPLPIAKKSEIRTGGAVIRSTIRGSTTQEYSVEIMKIYPGTGASGRNLLLKVTDPRLLEISGGIVQGMSGSPIIQDGKLIGAVTHVLVNDPTTGYGIFIENMLDAAA